jgi:phytoene synthase
VGEDAQRGRVYLPDDVLHPFGITVDEILHDPTLASQDKWAAMMRHEVARARALYDAAAPGLALLAPDAQRCARACADGYALILGALEGIGYDSLHTRARVGNWVRAGLMWNIWRMTPLAPSVCASETPVIIWREQQLARAEEMCA